MTTVAEDLTRVRLKLHDSGTLWSDAELLRWYRDGYRALLAQSQAVRRWVPFDSPGRHTYAITFEWEDRHAYRGTVRKLHRTVHAGTRSSTGLWEAQAIEGITPTVQFGGFTQEWEREYAGASDHHFRFTLPRNHERLVRVEWQGRRLSPVATRDLDNADSNWMQQAGLPRWWTTGTGRVKAIDVYEVDDTIHQGYALYDYERGAPRSIAGDLSYSYDPGLATSNRYAYTGPADAYHVTPLAVRFTLGTAVSSLFAVNQWEVEHVAGSEPDTVGALTGIFVWEQEYATVGVAMLGTVRRILGGTRQYLAVYSDATVTSLCGRVLDWRSSEDSMLALEVVIPDTDVQTGDTPALLPEGMQKYLRYYVLAMAFARVGEGRNPILADHYMRRVVRGITFFQRLGDVAHKDRVWMRDHYMATERRLPRVRLPATFERQW